MTKFEALYQQFQEAISRLDEILSKEKNDIVRDSAIKRFEMTFDLSWKVAKTFLEERKGIQCPSPKECFRAAYEQGIIEYDELWLTMTDWRNEAVHTYSEKFADDLYEKLPKTLALFQLLLERTKI